MQYNIMEKKCPKDKTTLSENKNKGNITIKTRIEWYKYIAKRYKTNNRIYMYYISYLVQVHGCLLGTGYPLSKPPGIYIRPSRS